MKHLLLLLLLLLGCSHFASAQATLATYSLSGATAFEGKASQTASIQLLYSLDGAWFSASAGQQPASTGFRRARITLPDGEVILSLPFAVSHEFYFRESEGNTELLPAAPPREILELEVAQ